MASGIRTIIFPVTDLAAAKARFQALAGAEPYVDQPYYVGFRFGDDSGRVEVGLDPHGHREPGGAVGYWTVDDIQGRLDALVAGGAETVKDVSDVGGGRLTAIVKDPDANIIGLLQPGDS